MSKIYVPEEVQSIFNLNNFNKLITTIKFTIMQIHKFKIISLIIAIIFIPSYQSSLKLLLRHFKSLSHSTKQKFKIKNTVSQIAKPNLQHLRPLQCLMNLQKIKKEAPLHGSRIWIV